jgi:hypothetical protein
MENKIYSIALALIACIIINKIFRPKCIIINGMNSDKIREIIYSK